MVKAKIPVTNDYIMKKIFSKKGNEDILKDFLIAILEIQIKKVEVQAEATLEKELVENKLGRLDILALLNDDTIINIEVQVLNPYNFIERTLFYWSGSYYNNVKSGKNYKEVKKTIAINILDYEQFEDGPYHEIARLRRDYQSKILIDKMEIHFIQIPKFIKEKRGIDTKIEQWMHFISQNNPKEVELAMKENKEIKKANDEYEYLTGDEAERRIAFLRDKAIRDENNMREGAREEGLKLGRTKGLEEGRKEGRTEIAKKMLAMNMKVEEVMEITELTKKEIEKIKKDMK